MANPRNIGNLIAPWRFIVFVAVLLVATPIAVNQWHNLALGVMAGFDVAAVVFFVLIIPVVQIPDPAVVHEHAKENDANRTGLVVLTGIVTVVLLAAIGAETMAQHPEPLTKGLVITTLFLAWLFSNLVYAFHYAHLAYRAVKSGRDSGIDFPGTKEPTYWDFIYFAFTLGMTFQTSDVTISDSGIRKFVTFHSFAAFVFNIGVLAFTINVLGSS